MSACLRKYVLALSAMILLGALAPKHSFAQLVQDKQQTEEGIKGVVAKFGYWYAQAQKWRDASIEKAHAMINRTHQVVWLRQKYESRAVGELGKLGGWVPDWRDKANFCGYDYNGYTICNIDRQLAYKFESILYGRLYELSGGVFQRIEAIEQEMHHLLGSQFDAIIAPMERRFWGTPRERRTASAPFMIAQAETSAELQEAAHRLNAMIDEIYEEQIEGEPISSGRAKQLAAHLAYFEAVLEMEIARSKIKRLDLATTSTARQVSNIRRSHALTHNPARW